MKLLFCGHCADIVKLNSERRYCLCGKSWGRYLEDGSTTVQSDYTLSLGIHNHDFKDAIKAYNENPQAFSPVLTFRAWINPISEPDVKFVEETESGDELSPPKSLE